MERSKREPHLPLERGRKLSFLTLGIRQRSTTSGRREETKAVCPYGVGRNILGSHPVPKHSTDLPLFEEVQKMLSYTPPQIQSRVWLPQRAAGERETQIPSKNQLPPICEIKTAV